MPEDVIEAIFDGCMEVRRRSTMLFSVQMNPFADLLPNKPVESSIDNVSDQKKWNWSRYPVQLSLNCLGKLKCGQQGGIRIVHPVLNKGVCENRAEFGIHEVTFSLDVVNK